MQSMFLLAKLVHYVFISSIFTQRERSTTLIILICVSDLEWKMIYVGSAESEEFDQVLDTIYVGPIPEGRHMFVFQVKHHESSLLS